MKKGDSTRRVEDLRHYNDQNPNVNPGRTRSRAPQMVREGEYTGQLRTILIAAPRAKVAEVSGREINGAPLPIKQAVGGRRYE